MFKNQVMHSENANAKNKHVVKKLYGKHELICMDKTSKILKM